MVTLAPEVPIALTPYLASWVGYAERLPADSVHHGLPSTTLTVVLAFDEPLWCGWHGDPVVGQFRTLVAGLHDTPAIVHTRGWQHGVQLGLTPRGARALFGVPAAALGRTMIEAGDESRIGAVFTTQAHDRLESASWSERFALLGEQLLASVSRGEHRQMRPELAQAWRLTVDHAGRMPVAEIARRVGWSRRHLLSGFVDEFGLSPKRAARLARFEAARALHRGGRPLSEIAAQCGYADQSHLNRDWRDLAAQTPRESEADFPIVLDDPAPPP